ncbi:hypothetical protein Tco_0479041, partial [Tanacetum coccineum]
QGNSKEVRTPRYLSLVVPLRKVGDEALHKELGDKMERAATTASSSKAEHDIVMKRRCDINHKWVMNQTQGNLKEVGTLRYLSLVVPLRKVGDEAIYKELGDRMEGAAITASSSEAKQDSGSGPRCQDTIFGDVDAQTRHQLLLLVQVPAAEETKVGENQEGRRAGETAHAETEKEEIFLIHLPMIHCPVLDLEKAKSDQAIEIASLKKRVDKLEKRRHTAGEAVTTASVEDSAAPTIQVSTTGIGEVTTAKIDELTLAQTLIEIKAAKPKVVTTAATTTTRPKGIGVVVQEPSEFRVPQESQPSISKDKGKDIASDCYTLTLATKLPVIVDYKLHKEGMLVHYQLIRADGSSKRYSSMIRMLQGIDREDLEVLWRIVKAKHNDTRPEDEFKRVLWGDLKVMFEPDTTSDVWRMLQGYRVTIWKLIDSSRVHFVRICDKETEDSKAETSQFREKDGCDLKDFKGHLRFLMHMCYWYKDTTGWDYNCLKELTTVKRIKTE